MDVNDINPHVRDRVENLHPDGDSLNHKREWLSLSFPTSTEEQNITHSSRPYVCCNKTGGTSGERTLIQKPLDCSLDCDILLDDAVDVFCEFFLPTTPHLPPFGLNLNEMRSNPIFHKLLEFIHDTTSVQQLGIVYPPYLYDDLS
jgi:hypothetical protein